MDDANRLLGLKQDIESAKENIAKLKGRKESIMDELKKDWECATLQQAVKAVVKFQKQADVLSVKIDANMAEIEKRYEL